MDRVDPVMDIIDRKSKTVAQPKFISTQVSDVRYYYLDLHPAPTPGITVVCGGRERCNPEYVISRRGFPFLSIECVAQGRGEVKVAGQTFRLQAGSVFSYAPGVAHTIRNDPKDPMVKYFVDFTGQEAARLLRDGPLRRGVVQLLAPGEILDIFEDLQRQGSGDAPGSAAICAALVRLLILKITALAVPEREADARALATYQRCKRQIEQHFLGLRSLAQAARACHVDQAYLCRLFRRFDHQTPYHYLVRLKMNRAAELLLGPGRLIKQVAEELGFTDPYHFSRVFKSVHRLSPVRFIQAGHRRTDRR